MTALGWGGGDSVQERRGDHSLGWGGVGWGGVGMIALMR